jgi:hypothetical protein
MVSIIRIGNKFSDVHKELCIQCPHFEKQYEMIRERLISQFINYRRPSHNNPIIAAKKLKFTPKSKRRRYDENDDPTKKQL